MFTHRMIRSISLQNSIVNSKSNVTYQGLSSDPFQFSRFVKVSARNVKQNLIRIAAKNQNSTGPFNLTVMHIRGGDRGCVLTKLNDTQLVDKIASFGLPQKNGILYLMTNMPKRGAHFNAIQNYFKNHSFFDSEDIAMFKRREFTKMGSYLVYVVEKQLQRYAEGVIVSYIGYVDAGFKDRVVGILAPPECGPMGVGIGGKLPPWMLKAPR